MSINIAIFASGAGSNAQKIIEHFNRPGLTEQNGQISGAPPIKVALVACNRPGAGVLQVAAAHNIPTLLLEKGKFFRGNAYVDELQAAHINIIVLAGFLWKVPSALISAWPGKIINIHPALLPKYGGKGMYGNFVHEAVIASGDKESGITIHLVDELFDHGKPIFQAICPVLPGDTPDTLAKRIHALEHANFPRVIEEFAKHVQ